MKRIEQEKEKLKQQQAEDERLRMAIEQAEERREMEVVENNLRRTQLQESGLYFAGSYYYLLVISICLRVDGIKLIAIPFFD